MEIKPHHVAVCLLAATPVPVTVVMLCLIVFYAPTVAAGLCGALIGARTHLSHKFGL